MHLPWKSCARGASRVSGTIRGGGARRASSETGLGSTGGNHACSFAAYPSSEGCFPDISGEEQRASRFRRVKQSLAQCIWTLFTTAVHGNGMKKVRKDVAAYCGTSEVPLP